MFEVWEVFAILVNRIELELWNPSSIMNVSSGNMFLDRP